MLRLPVTGVVLAGGSSRRMGRNKAWLELDGRSLIDVVIERMQAVCDEVLVVVGDASQYTGLRVPVVEDSYPGVGVLGGLHAGLEAATNDLIIAVACDMPFLQPALLYAFVDWADGMDVVVFRKGEYVEPLHAVYRRSCLPAIEAAIQDAERRIISFFPQVRVRYVTVDEVAAFDPELWSFRNANTPEEWAGVERDWLDSRPGRW